MKNFFVMLTFSLFFFACQKDEIYSPPEAIAPDNSLAIVQESAANETLSFPAKTTVDNFTVKGAEPCGCKFEVVSASNSLAGLPGVTYWLGRIHYTTATGAPATSSPIGLWSDFFPSERDFTAKRGTPFDVEFSYHPTENVLISGWVKFKVSCSTAPSVDYTFIVNPGSPAFQEFQSGAITDECGTIVSSGG